ncbi:MAG: amino acid adenylation domain-containing protein [Deltaproteobacteria bacterium]|nr:amino acid adenylation domain-containing protein [Deltaproteobacteria bacterium]
MVLEIPRSKTAHLRSLLEAQIERHATLRCTFPRLEAMPMQRLMPWAPLDFETREFWSKSVRLREVDKEIQRPFDLAQGPLVRFRLYTCPPKKEVLVITAHPLVLDLTSFARLLEELEATYGSTGGELEDRLLQVPDYAGAIEATRSRAPKLGSAHDRMGLRLSVDRPRSGAIPEERVKRFALEKGLAPSPNTLLAAFSVLLGRYSGEREVSLVTGQALREEEELPVGCFETPVLLNVNLLAHSSGGDLVKALESEPPFSKAKVSSPVALFLPPSKGRWMEEVIGALSGVESGKRGEGRLFRLVRLSRPRLRRELELVLLPRKKGWTGVLRFDAHLFDATTISRLIEHFKRLVEGIIRDPHCSLSRLTSMSFAQRHQVSSEWGNGSPATVQTYNTVNEMVSAQARRVPDQPALVVGKTRISYQQMEVAAEALARGLRHRGVVPEARVAVLLERSPEAIIALLAVMKAGGAFLFLDPSWPKHRIELILRDAAPAGVLTKEGLKSRAEVEGVALWEIEQLSQEQESPSLWRAGASENLCYVIYTSGSTGVPKGVGVEHRQLLHYIQGVIEGLGLEERRSFAVLSTLAADLSYTSIFSALACGGCLHLLPQEQAVDPESLTEQANTEPYDCLKIVPSHLRALLSGVSTGALLPRQTLILGGEESLHGDLERVRQWRPDLTVCNHYGPTESTVGVVGYRSEPSEALATEGRGLPLGRPFAGVEVRVVDSQGFAVAPGIPGELLIGGATLSRGYLAAPGMTAEKFRPDPQSAVPGGRVYSSGDRVRFRGDGLLEFLGRVDDQVKVRGYRIEPEEVAQVLRSLPQVQEAVIVPWRDRSGTMQLAAYYRPRAARLEADGAVLEVLRKTLPPPQVPAVLIPVSEIPLTTNGKVDRQRLPSAEAFLQAARGEGGRPPQTPTECGLADIWSRLLTVPEPRLGDNFFALGGHSLLLVRLLNLIRQEFGLRMTYAGLVSDATLEAQARNLERVRSAGKVGQIPSASIPPMPDEAPIPASAIQRHIWFVQALTQGRDHVHRAVRIHGSLQPLALAKSIRDLASRHEALRARFKLVGGDLQQTISSQPYLPLDHIDLSLLSGDRQEAVSQDYVQRTIDHPFDLSVGPVARGLILEIAEGENILVLVAHHIVLDGWSMEQLFSELQALYRLAVEDEGEVSRTSGLRYRDFAFWQRDLERQERARYLDFWNGMLSGVEPLLPALLAEAGYLGQGGDGVVTRRLPEGISAKVEALAREYHTTPFVVALGALSIALWRRSGRHTLVVNTDLAARSQPGLEDIVGSFAFTLPLRIEMDGAVPVVQFLTELHKSVMEFSTYQDIPFDVLASDLKPDAINAISSVGFQYAVYPPQRYSEAVLGLTPLPVVHRKLPEGLVFSLQEWERGLDAVCHYDSERLSNAYVEDLTADVCELLGSALRQSDVLLSDVQHQVALPVMT